MQDRGSLWMFDTQLVRCTSRFGTGHMLALTSEDASLTSVLTVLTFVELRAHLCSGILISQEMPTQLVLQQVSVKHEGCQPNQTEDAFCGVAAKDCGGEFFDFESQKTHPVCSSEERSTCQATPFYVGSTLRSISW